MAVSFKVPKSPKRDIFVIDNFQGVDLTNTETSVDENKSPNAVNMVRLVPGKVRKRTGYKSRILFSDGTDVNRVVNSTENYVDIDLDSMGDTLETGIPIAEFYDILKADYGYWIKVETEGQGSFQFAAYPNVPNNYWHHVYSEGGEFYQFWGLGNSYNTEGIRDIRVYKTAPSQDGDFLRVRKCYLSEKCSKGSARNIVWTPAPEDRGAKFVKRPNIDPIFGCHILKTYDANRVVNVNRVLGTSDTFDTFTVNTTDWQTLYQLQEAIYISADSSIRTNLSVELDYICDGDCYLSVGSWYYSNNPLHDTNGSTEHFSYKIDAGSYYPPDVKAKAVSTNVNLQIKKLSVMYQKDNSYVWTPAPEDSGKEFHVEDIYNSLPNNYAINESYYFSQDSTGLSAIANIPIGNALSHVLGFAHISFNAETSTSEELNKVIVRILNSSNDVLVEKEFTENIQQNFDFYLGSKASGKYFETIQIEFQLASADATCLALLKNIAVKQIQLRSEYNIFAKNYLYHVGKDLYLYSTASDTIDKVYTNMNQARSQSWQLNDKLILLDGKTVFLYEFGNTPTDITGGSGYIPLVTIAKSPGGSSGGVSYEPLNLIQPAYQETFCVTSAKANEPYFYLSFQKNDYKSFIVEVMNGNGDWVKKTLNVDYYENFSEGWVYFISGHLPGVSPISGHDNVRITAYRTVDGYADRIKKCTIGTLFGVGGASDRLFLSGNPDHPNWDFYSEQFNPTYFPDTGYAMLGSASSSIVGYAIVNNYLATFKDEYDPGQNVTIREGDLVVKTIQFNGADMEVSEPAFKIINTLQGNGVVAPYSFAYLQTEPLFLTRSGIMAITPQDLTGERYAQLRSFYLNGKLTQEEDLDTAVAVIFNDQYMLAVNGKLYILDGLQPIRTDKSAPYATRQYAGFYCTDVPAACIWVDDQALWIGTYDGKVCRFDNDIEDLESYNDDGEPIYCCWETPDLDGKLFYKNKTFRYFAARIMNALRTSCKLYSNKLGSWTLIKEDNASGTIFDFELIDFERFSFNTDTSAKVIHTKVRVKKVDKAKFKIENDTKNEPFGLFDLALEYIESGNYKG